MENNNEIIQIKKGRGRPRKEKIEIVKKPKGRPRKYEYGYVENRSSKMNIERIRYRELIQIEKDYKILLNTTIKFNETLEVI